MISMVRLPLLFLAMIWLGALGTAPARSPETPAVIANSSHSSYVKSIVYAPNGTWLASGAEDGTVKLWDAKSGRLLRTLAELKDEVVSVAISPDGGHVAAVSHDGAAKIWEAESGQRPLMARSGLFRWVAMTSATDPKRKGVFPGQSPEPGFGENRAALSGLPFQSSASGNGSRPTGELTPSAATGS